MRVHSVIVSVPWRQRSLENLLRSLSQQTWPVDRVTLLLQTYSTDPAVPSDLPVHIERVESNEGPGIRWRFIEECLRDDTIALVLDDDFSLAPDYVERTVEPIVAGRADATGWYGLSRSFGFLTIGRVTRQEVPLYTIAGGTHTSPAGFLRGVSKMRRLLRLDGADDCASSIALRANGAQLLRPAGPAPIAHAPEQWDFRSIKMTRSADAARLFAATRLAELAGLLPRG